jgi:PAS domain S-box-containing protein
MTNYDGAEPADPMGGRIATEEELRATLEAIAPGEADGTLAKLASALFPAGIGSFSQVTWPESGGTATVTQVAADDAETKLRTAELRYRTLIEQIPAVTFMAVLGEGDNEVYVSPHIEALLGFTQTEWLENPFLWYTQLHPDDREIWHQEFARGCRTGGPFRAECRFLARDGRVVWVHGEARLVKDDLGRPLFLQGVAFDITEAKKAEATMLRRAVQTTEERYRDLVEQLGAIFWEAEPGKPGFTFVSGGAQQILGFPADKWLADPDFWLSRVHPDDRAEAATAWQRARTLGAGSAEFEFRAVTADDRTVWLHQRVHFHRSGSGEPRLLGVILDVTDQKRTEETLRTSEARLRSETAAAEKARASAETANRAKDEFLATMSHELRTPLNAVLGWTTILRNTVIDKETRQRALETIERNARAQAQLIEDLLDVSRIVTGKLILEPTPVNLGSLIGSTLDSVKLAADAKQIEIRRHVATPAPVVSGDAARLHQVVSNLLTNAVKFTPNGGWIEVRVERRDGTARISVTDNGQGIDAAFLPHVFERFRQADGTATRSHGGLGLGLAIARHLIDLHGGQVRAESLGLGLGSTFIVEIPLLREEIVSGQSDGPTLEELKETHRALAGLHILVVEDEVDARDLMTHILEQAGGLVTSAASAAEALEMIEALQPDVLVSDVGMPHQDGYELIRAIRLRGAPVSDVPALAVTAYARAEDRERALAAGFEGHVAKPILAHDLVRNIKRLARRTT